MTAHRHVQIKTTIKLQLVAKTDVVTFTLRGAAGGFPGLDALAFRAYCGRRWRRKTLPAEAASVGTNIPLMINCFTKS